MKKVVIVLLIAILIVGSMVMFLYWRGEKKNPKPTAVLNTQANYGNRGNISQTEKIKFLSKNDDYLTGMIGIPISKDIKKFTNDDVIRFSLNIAVKRYSNLLTTRINREGNNDYIVPVSVVNSIADEYFGIKEVEFDVDENEYYSKLNKAFVLENIPEITLYYYPVYMENISRDSLNTENTVIVEENSVENDIISSNEVYIDNQSEEENEVLENENSTNEISIDEEESNYKMITVDSIFISDDNEVDIIENARYNGKYGEDAVDSNVKFIFNNRGKLIAYQYVIK